VHVLFQDDLEATELWLVAAKLGNAKAMKNLGAIDLFFFVFL